PCNAQLPQRAVDPASLPMKALSDDERTRLGRYITGRGMPYPSNIRDDVMTPLDVTQLPLTFDELEQVRAWIAQGAPVNECVACLRPRCPDLCEQVFDPEFPGCAPGFSCLCEIRSPSTIAGECRALDDAGVPAPIDASSDAGNANDGSDDASIDDASDD